MGKRKSIKANFVFQFIYQIFVALVPIVTAPYLSRTLGAEGIGIYAYNYAIAYYFVLFTNLGIENYGAKVIASITDNYIISKKFWELTFLKMIIGSVSLIIYLTYVTALVTENRTVAVIFSLYIISAMMDINWFYVGIEEFKLLSMRNIAVKIFTIICIFTFVHSFDDLNKYTLIMVGGAYFLSELIGWGFIICRLKVVIPRIANIKKHVKPLLVLFVPVLALSVYRQMDKIMLGNLSDNFQVGIYEYTEKIYMILICVVSVSGNVGMPRVVSLLANRNRDQAITLVNRFVDFALCLSIAMSFGISAIADHFIILFYGGEFIVCAELISLLSVTIIFLSFSVIIRKEYLIPFGKEKIFVQATCIGAAINLVINAILIPGLQAKGAIIATIITELFVMLYQLIRIRKELPIRRYFFRFLWFLFAGMIMWAAIKLLWRTSEANWLVVIGEIAVGAAIYALATIAFLLRYYRKKATAS